MSEGILRQLIYIYIYYLTGVFGVRIDPRPIANCQRYNSLAITCAVQGKWDSVGFYLQKHGTGLENMALFVSAQQDCFNLADPIPGLYNTSCNYSSGIFDLIINNITDIKTYHGKNITCSMIPGPLVNTTTINVQYAPTSSPSITQIPNGPVKIGNNVKLTCSIPGGNPLATIVWQCPEFTSIPSTGAPPTDVRIASIERVVTKDDNGKECICRGEHLLWDNNKEKNHKLNVYFPPTTNLSIIQTPPGPLNVSVRILLSCEIEGGNPLAAISWTCEGSQPAISTESPMTNKSVSNILLTVNESRNGDVCTCQGSHPTWNQNKVDTVMFDVRYPPNHSPTITQVPSGAVIAGQMVKLTCTILGGNPLATIVWECSGFQNSSETVFSSTNRISSIERLVTKEDNLKACICRGTHPFWDRAKDKRHILIVYFEPTNDPFIIQTPPNPVNDSDLITLYCEVRGGNPVAVISWQCEGSQPVTPTERSLTNISVSIVQLTVSEERNGDVCTCTGFHPAWTKNKTSTITFDVRYAPTLFPSITQIPEGPVIEGTNVTLSCTIAGGNPLATIVWECSHFTTVSPTDMPSEDQVVSSVEGILTKVDNSKECICTGNHLLWTNERNTSFNFNVYYATTIQIKNIQPVKIVQNNSILLECTELDGNPRNASFTWYMDDAIISTTANHSITSAKANDTGNYTCDGSNEIGHDEAIIEVYVLYPPKISALSAPYGNTIEENGTAVLLCTVQSYPLPKIILRKHGGDLTLQNNGHELQSHFTIEHVTCFHTDTYTCKATNIIDGKEYSSIKEVNLFVKCSPRLYNNDQDSTNVIGLAIGQNLTLSKHILAYPTGEVTWRFKRDINSSQSMIHSTLNCSTNNVFEHQICFMRLNLTESDFGMYTAEVVNDKGNVTFTYIVNPQGPPYESYEVRASCGVLTADISWLTGFNGGQEQTFYVTVIDNDGIMHMHKTGIVGKKKGQLKSHSLNIRAGLFRFDIFGNNSFGSATVIGDSCEVKGLDDNKSVIGLAAGLGSSFAVLAIIIVVAVIVFRKRNASKKGEDSKRFMRSETKTNEDEDDGKLTDNPLYVTSDTICDGENGPVYSVVNKSKRAESSKTSTGGAINKGPVYSDVSKTTKIGLRSNGIEMENVYSNSEKFLQDNIEDSVYLNAECHSDRVDKNDKVYRPNKNKDGLIYADLDLEPNTTGSRYVIRGLDNKTNYAIIDLNIKVDPLPSDDDDNDENKENEKETLQ